MGLEHQHRPSHNRTIDPDMDLGSSPGSDATMVPDGSAGHSDRHGSSGSMVLRHQHGSRWWPRPLASAWVLMVSGAIDNIIDPEWPE